MRDGLGDANNFVEDILGGRTNRVGGIATEDGDNCVVVHLISTKVSTAKGIVVRLGEDSSTRLNKWKRAHYRC